MSTATKSIEVGDVFGYRKVVEVTTRNISYINLNGRKRDGAKNADEKERKVFTLTRGEFRELVGI